MQTGPEFLLSVSSYKGILYLENFGGVQLKEPPCRFLLDDSKNILQITYNK